MSEEVEICEKVRMRCGARRRSDDIYKSVNGDFLHDIDTEWIPFLEAD